MCNFLISWFRDIVVDTSWCSGFMWFCDSQLWNCDDRNICMFSWFVNLWCHGGYYQLPWHLNNLRQWWILPWRLNNLRSCELRRCGWGTTTWNSGFMLFETKLAGIDTFRCLRTGSKFCQSRLVCTTWICWNQFLANRIRDLFCFDRTSLNSLFWWNQNSLNGSVNWVVAVWECQRMFPVILCRWRLHCYIGCCFVS